MNSKISCLPFQYFSLTSKSDKCVNFSWYYRCFAKRSGDEKRLTHHQRKAQGFNLTWHRILLANLKDNVLQHEGRVVIRSVLQKYCRASECKTDTPKASQQKKGEQATSSNNFISIKQQFPIFKRTFTSLIK